MEYINGHCPQCGKALQVPPDLQEFSCMYCGARTNAEAIQKDVSEETYLAERAYLKENLPLTVTRYPENYKKMTRKEFIPTFEAYENENTKIVRRLDVCMIASPIKNEACVAEICKDLLDGIDAHLHQQPKWEKKAKQQDLLFATRVVLAIFLTPLVRKLRLESAELFCEQLNRQWLERYPQHKWMPADYDVLVKGYKKRGFCFITTAACLHENKADDCDELTAFRAFRDGWMMQNGCQAQVARYYEIAPAIVQCIDYCDDADTCYAFIREKWLDPCYHALKEQRNEDCHALYSDMVERLCQRYLQ